MQLEACKSDCSSRDVAMVIVFMPCVFRPGLKPDGGFEIPGEASRKELGD